MCQLFLLFGNGEIGSRPRDGDAVVVLRELEMDGCLRGGVSLLSVVGEGRGGVNARLELEPAQTYVTRIAQPGRFWQVYRPFSSFFPSKFGGKSRGQNSR